MVANIAKLRTGMISVIYLSYKISNTDPIWFTSLQSRLENEATKYQLVSVHYIQVFLINLHNLRRREPQILSLYNISVDEMVM